MRRITLAIVGATAVLFAVLGGTIWAADKYSVKVPDGLSLSEFKGYEGWQVVAVSQPNAPETRLAAILGNPIAIQAFQAGVPGNGKPFPDGAKLAKIHWKQKKNPNAPYSVWVPDFQEDAGFMIKDSKRFADSHGWGYAEFNYNAASDTYTPAVTGTKCGAACHTIRSKEDYVFTSYAHR